MAEKSVMEYYEIAKLLRIAADAMEDAQRANQHLWGIATYWANSTDEEKREAVNDARERLNRVYEAQREMVS